MKDCCKESETPNSFSEAISKEAKPTYLEKLKQKWQLKSVMQVIIVLIIFTIGGSTCAFLAKKTINIFAIENRTIYIIVYVLLATIYWPICVLIYSIILGQYQFFKKYLSKMGKRMIGKK